MKKYNNVITVIFVSYHSDEIIKKTLKKIPSQYEILVTDNALSEHLKSDLENNFSNVSVIKPKKNLGNGAGVNFALNKVSTKYALYLDVDTEIEEDTIDRLLKIANIKSDWGIIAPNLKDYAYKREYFLEKELSKDILSMKFVEGCALLFNLEIIKEIGFYDEKIFLYFEENDLFYRCIKNNLKILLCKNIYIKHFGNSSIDIKYNFEIELNRNWHYMWSKFYYYKKNYSYLKGLRETMPQFIKASIKFIFYYFINKKQFLIYKNRSSGLYNSYLNKPSWRRPEIK